MPTRLVLVRHGESLAQERRVIGGHVGCTGLSARGRRQVEALRDRLLRTEELRADVFLTSVLPRAIETAAIIAPAIGAGDATQLCDFCEIHPGVADGMTWDERDVVYRPEPGWTWTPDTTISPGGESWRELVARVTGAIERVVSEHAGRTIVIACHGGVVRASFHHFFGLDVAAADHLDVVNASMTEWQLADGHPGDPARRWRLRRFGDHAHLMGTDLLA